MNLLEKALQVNKLSATTEERLVRVINSRTNGANSEVSNSNTLGATRKGAATRTPNKQTLCTSKSSNL